MASTIMDIRQLLVKRLLKSNKTLSERQLWIKQFDYDSKRFDDRILVSYWNRYMNVEFAYDLLREKN